MTRFQFTEEAWRQYKKWETEDNKTIKRINDLMEDIGRNGNKGIGKPEPLRGDFSGLWSRRIDAKNRLVYRINGDVCEIYQCKGHYEEKVENR